MFFQHCTKKFICAVTAIDVLELSLPVPAFILQLLQNRSRPSFSSFLTFMHFLRSSAHFVETQQKSRPKCPDIK